MAIRQNPDREPSPPIVNEIIGPNSKPLTIAFIADMAEEKKERKQG